jgi:hypothetical protein
MADSTVKMEDDSSNHKDPRGKHPAKSMQRTDSADELEHASDEGDTKSKAKRCKRPTNGTNLPDAVRPDSVLWKITILGVYRAHIACTNEVWSINDGTALRHLQIIWDFHMKGKKTHQFLSNDPIIPLVSNGNSQV